MTERLPLRFASLPPPKQNFIRTWVIGLVLLYGTLTGIALYAVAGERHAADESHAIRMSANRVEPGLTAPDPLPESTDFARVSVGLYLDDIDSFSIKDSTWSATFFLWFRWKGDKALDPAKTFQLVDAKVEKRDVVDAFSGEDGTNYQRVRVTAKMFKAFNTTRVPLDDHLLTIVVEDSSRDAAKLRYEADAESNVSSRAKVAGYKLTGNSTVVKSHTYKTSYGDPRVKGRRTFTQFVMGVNVRRASMGLYFKLLLGLFAGILLTLASFFIRPSDTSPRFSLPTASYFGAVANSYLVSSMVPSSGQFGLLDYVTGLGLFTIFVCLSASLLSGYYYLIKKDEVFSKLVDRTTRTTILIVYVLANVVLPLSAYARF